MEKFEIKEEDQRRLIIDLLVRLCAEAEINRHYLTMVLSQGQPQVLENMQKAFRNLYSQKSQELRGIIFGNYGHIDIDDFFPPDDGSKNA